MNRCFTSFVSFSTLSFSNSKSLEFCSVGTLSAQLHCHWDYFIAATRTVHTCRTEALHAILSFLISLFAFYDPQSQKILLFYYFQILLSKKVGGGRGGMAWFAAPVLLLLNECRQFKQ